MDDTEYGVFDLNDEESKIVDELQKPQEGLFHQWGIEIITDEDTGIAYKRPWESLKTQKAKFIK